MSKLRKQSVFAYFLALLLPLFGVADVATQKTIAEVLNFVIQPPQFSEGLITLQSVEKIIEVVAPILSDRLQQLAYDRVVATTQFLDHYEHCKIEDPNILPLEAFKSFKFDPFKPPFKGGPCVSLTLDIYAHLPTDLNSYIVAAKLPTRYQQFALPQFCHTAVLIHFQDPQDPSCEGFVVLDPSFDFPVPIVLKKNEPTPFVCDMGEKGLWEFSLTGDKIVCEIYNKQRASSKSFDEEEWRLVYRTDRLLNPIESSAAPMILADRRLSFLTRSPRGVSLAHLNVELNKERIVWDDQGGFFEPISFTKFINDTWLFPEPFASTLRLSQSDLFSKIERIIVSKETLDDLYTSYLALILELDDFSITGAIDKKETQAIINKY